MKIKEFSKRRTGGGENRIRSASTTTLCNKYANPNPDEFLSLKRTLNNNAILVKTALQYCNSLSAGSNKTRLRIKTCLY